MKRLSDFLLLLGCLLLAAAAALGVRGLAAEHRAAAVTQTVLQTLEEAAPGAPFSYPADPDADSASMQAAAFPPDYTLDPSRDMPVTQIRGNRYIGILSIPSLSVSLPIADDWKNGNLDCTPCRYSGSAYTDDLVLLGHNYAAHFGALRELEPGDAVTFTDADGNEFFYSVCDAEILPPDAVEAMVNGDWGLTLFTCTVGGQNRLAVRCVRVDT